MTQGIPNIAATEKVRHAAVQEASRMVWQTDGKIVNREIVPFSCDRSARCITGCGLRPCGVRAATSSARTDCRDSERLLT